MSRQGFTVYNNFRGLCSVPLKIKVTPKYFTLRAALAITASRSLKDQYRDVLGIQDKNKQP